MNLLDQQFDRRPEEKTEELLTKAENQIAALWQYSEFLTQKNYEKAKEHLKEVDKLEADIKKSVEFVQQKRPQEKCRTFNITCSCSQAPSSDR